MRKNIFIRAISIFAAMCCMMLCGIEASAELIRIAGGTYDTDSYKDETKFLVDDEGCVKEGEWDIFPEPNFDKPSYNQKLIERYPFEVKEVIGDGWYRIYFGPVETDDAYIHVSEEELKSTFYVLYRETKIEETTAQIETAETSTTTTTETILFTETTVAESDTEAVEITTAQTTEETTVTTATSARYIRIAGGLYDTESYKDEIIFCVDDQGCVKEGEWDIFPEPNFDKLSYETKLQERYPFTVKKVIGNSWYQIYFGPVENDEAYIHVTEEELKSSFYVLYRENKKEETQLTKTQETTTTTTTETLVNKSNQTKTNRNTKLVSVIRRWLGKSKIFATIFKSIVLKSWIGILFL